MVNGKPRSSIMPEDYEESILLTLRTRSSKKPLGVPERNWKRQWLPLCFARHARRARKWRSVAKLNEFKTKFACILEASEYTRLCMEESLPNYHEDHIAGRGDNSLQHYNLVHKFIPMPQATKIPAAQAAVEREWQKLETIPAWELRGHR